ncbi:MAG: hypothetical protein JKY65_25660 [Planctomycetes bacterium]|nr:hypothetical protein [Planctomycetota bacterium]
MTHGAARNERVRIVSLSACLLALLASVPASADQIELKDGRVLEGEVIERGDDKIVLKQSLGSMTFSRRDIVRIVLDEGGKKEQKSFDVVVLRDGTIIQGDVSISKDGGDVIVGRGNSGQVKHPRAVVSAIHWRDGREELSDPDHPAGGKALANRIERLLKDLRRMTPNGQPDLATRGEARRELLSLGVFARRIIEKLREGVHKEAADEVLADLRRLADVRKVIPTRLEEKIPRLAERLISPVANERESALRSVAMEAPAEAGPLLLYFVKNDGSPRLRAYSVNQLSALRRFEELADVLKLSNGPLRLAAAFALGEAGIYAGIPVLIEALRLPDILIRKAAAAKLRVYTAQHFGFRAKGTPEDRAKAVSRWNAWWKKDGWKLARSSIRQSAPDLKGAKVSNAERAAAAKLWIEASRMVTIANAPLEPKGKTPAQRRESLAALGKGRKQTLQRALILIERSLDLDPGLVSARLTRATLYYEEFNKPGAARKELRLLLDRARHDSSNPDVAHKFAHYHLGRIEALEKAFRRAAVRFGQALDYEPGFLAARVAQGDAYFEHGLSMRGRSDEDKKLRSEAFAAALVSFRAGLETVKAKDEELLDLIKGIRSRRRDVEESQVIQAVRRNRIALRSQRAEIHFRVGRLQAARGLDSEALDAYREAMQTDPKEPRYKKAVQFWERLQRDRGKAPPKKAPVKNAPVKKAPSKTAPGKTGTLGRVDR